MMCLSVSFSGGGLGLSPAASDCGSVVLSEVTLPAWPVASLFCSCCFLAFIDPPCHLTWPLLTASFALLTPNDLLANCAPLTRLAQAAPKSAQLNGQIKLRAPKR